MRVFFTAVVMCLGVAATAQDAPLAPPLSAIDWLSEQGSRPTVATDVARSVTLPDVETMPLVRSAAAYGIIPPELANVSGDLWLQAQADDLIARLGAIPMDLPAGAAEFLNALMLARVAAPVGAEDAFLMARARRLWDVGAVEEVHALLSEKAAENADAFDLYFQSALLVKQEQQACDLWNASPWLSGEPMVQIFCLARAGKWAQATSNLFAAQALGTLAPSDAELLTGFLEPELIDDLALAPLDKNATALQVILRKSLGHGVSTADLPPAFAVLDLDGTSGWRAQLWAAERLARLGSLPANQFLGIFARRKPSASGGVWERVRAVRDMETALATNDPAQIGPAIETLWDEMAPMGLVPITARLFGPELAKIDPPQGFDATWARFVYLSEPAVAMNANGDEPARYIAMGQAMPDHIVAQISNPALGAALQHGFAPLDQTNGVDQTNGANGVALLHVFENIAAAQSGNYDALRAALIEMRRQGQEARARHIALEFLFLGGE